jgi:hypothetical protein
MGKWIKPVVIIVVLAFAALLMLYAFAYALITINYPIRTGYDQTATIIISTNQAVEHYIDMTSTAKASTPSP